MSDSQKTLEEHYRECFEGELRALKRRMEVDKDFTVDVVRGTLETLYNVDGNNWDGRSAVFQIEIDAQIDAFEKFLHDWKEKK